MSAKMSKVTQEHQGGEVRKRGHAHQEGWRLPKKLKIELENNAPTHQDVLSPESDSDGDEMLEATYSSMEQPPLIKQLRGILSEYPDNGQIIKEMLQNAEDAEASQVEIIYDERCINQEEDKKKTFRKFFKGPALCVKNNSLFEETDWRGIKMIASSVKEDDKLKVGRFGLGFKSVFHMTDYPCIMSGDRILLVDPTCPSDQVNAEIKLKNIRKTRGMDVEAFFQAFRDTLNIDESVINQGFYKGTVFWFPLRQNTSKISSTVYNRGKVMDLFESFEHDSSEILLFLCHLECVSLHIRSKTCDLQSVASAELSGKISDVRQRREEFVKLIKETAKSNQNHEPIVCTYEMTISTRNRNGSVNTKWIIVHYFMGTKCSTSFKQLVNDPDLGFNPLVGVAMPKTNTEQPFEGHVFCFMPLPREGWRLTGFPVHVNGFFSLSQNRHHLKWATDDQRVGEIRDKDILWNQALIQECVPEAFKELFKILLKNASDNRNDVQSVERIIRAVPDVKAVIDKWKRVPNLLINHLNQLKFLYSRCQDRYVVIGDALFTTNESRTADIIDVISQLNVNYVDTSMETISKLKFYNSNKVRDLTPSMLAKLLRQNVHIFSKLSVTKKFSILTYLLSGNDYNSCLAGLPLLPVVSGRWLTFGVGESVYICNSNEEIHLFEEIHDRLIYKSTALTGYIWHNLENMASNSIAQVRKLDVKAFKELLKTSHREKLGPSHIISNLAQLEWFKRVWLYIEENYKADQFEEIPLMPELREGNWDICKKIQLHPLNEIFLKKNDLPDNISNCFHNLGTVVLNDFPSWFPEQFVSAYLCVYETNDSTGIYKLLQKLWARPNSQRQIQIDKFNMTTSSNVLDKFVVFMSDHANLNISGIHLLRSLSMFKYGDFASNSTRYVSYNDHQTFIMKTGIPFRLPKAFILANEDSVQLLKRLGAHEVTYEDQVQLILIEMRKGTKYRQDDTKRFMNYFIDNIWRFLHSQNIMDLACEIPFLKTEHGIYKAKDLFSPEDELLKAIFCGESDKFPLDYSHFSSNYKTSLKHHLGLKDIHMVSAQNIGDVATLIHNWSSDSSRHKTFVTKANGVLEVLNKVPSLLQKSFGSSTLHSFLQKQSFVPCVLERPHQFPASLPHYNRSFCRPSEARERNYENECLVGATMPLINPKHSNLSSQFGWNTLLPFDKVIEQLMLLKQYFKVTEKSNTLPMIGQIYQYLSKNITNVNFSKIKAEGLIWTGDSFEHPSNVIIRVESQELADLSPYFFKIPVEFSMYENLFITVGCIPEQTVSVLMDVLAKVERKHSNPQKYEIYERDLELVVKIIDRLAERRHEIQGCDVILPVQNDSSSQIRFYPASKCTVDKNVRFVPEEGDNTIVFVSQRISHDSAKALGAKPFNKQVLMGTESMGIEGFGQTEKLTDRINKLIMESYVDGLSVPKELIQNADDAGADVVKFLFDEREHEDAKKLLLSQEMAGCQGPSLVVYNNAKFSDADFENIKKLNGATKEKDKSKVGRFGLGFCAVYNLTDVPSFVSRSTVVIFDPQKTYLKDALENNSPGIKIDFKKNENRKLLRLHEHQFKPYKGLFGCKIDKLPEKEYEGTLFRLPLRNSIQAEKSEISKLSYNRDEVCDLLTMLVQNVGNMLLFTQNVERIELYHLHKMAKSFEDKVLLFSAYKKLENRIPKPLSYTRCAILQRVATALTANKHFVETEQLKIGVSVTSDCSNLLKKTKDIKCSDESAWVVVWETGRKESLELSRRVKEDRAVPLSAVAVQCDLQFQSPIKKSALSASFYERGHLFCFLPLPIETSLAFHLNGSFHVTSDRRRLVALTDDDKDSRKDNWNEYLLSDASVNALFTLLEYFSHRNSCVSYSFYQLWPLHYKVVSAIHESFFLRIIQEEKPLFWGNGRWASFSNIVFLDAAIRNNPDIGDIGFRMLSCIGKTRGKVLVDLPEDFVNCFKKVQNIEESVIKETEILEIFLENISNSYWVEHIKDRNAILVYALKSNNIGIKSKIQECMCIPVEPHGRLKRPCDIVDKNGKIAAMYKIEEEVFLQTDLQNKTVIDELVSLGMVRDRLTDEMLLDRFASIEKLAATQCTRCALSLCQLLMNYMNDAFVIQDLKENVDLKENIAEMFIFPVLEKPKIWNFTWKSNGDQSLKTFNSRLCSTHEKDKSLTFKLGQPVHLYKQDLFLMGGSVCNFVDEDMIKCKFSLRKGMLKVLQVNKHISTRLITEQIGVISREYDDFQEKNENIVDIFSDILKCLQTRMKKEEKLDEVKNELGKIRGLPYIFVKRRLYTPDQLVFNLAHECSPYIMKVPDLFATKYKEVFTVMGVRDQLDAGDLIIILQEMKLQWEGRRCDNLDLIRNLLLNLAEFNNFNFSESVKDIVAPDSNGFLLPMNELVTYEDDFQTNRKLHVLHESIPHDIAKKLGAIDKQRKCHDEISRSIGIPFGQKEKLVSRIWNLLEAYPCDSSIMKELLQNADDAKATKIMFIKDYRNLSTQKIFADSCNDFQGPSLCVFNDSYFTDKDLQGIHDLGEGSKRQDPTKIGRYGVGFNSVYHLTDIPAFLSKGPEIPEDGFLVIFDPTCSTLPGVDENEPGRIYQVRDLQDEFCDILAGFNCREKLFVGDRGTLFRFPLRKTESSLSKKVHTDENIDNILDEITNEMFESLLFVKNVQCIEVANITSGELVVEYSVRAEISKDDQSNRSDFFEHIKKVCKEVKHNTGGLITVERKEVSYEMKVSDSRGREENFLIVQKFGFDDPTEIPQTITETFRRENLGYLPWGGVAYKTKGKNEMQRISRKSKAFCFLPVPGETPLPVHVNGFFKLDDARRGPIKDGFGKEWNECVLKYLVVPAYMKCVSIWRDILAGKVNKLKKSYEVEDLSSQYHEIFPLMENILDPYWKFLTSEFYRFIIRGKYNLFPVFKVENESKRTGQVESSIKQFKCEWVPVGLKGDLKSGCFNTIGSFIQNPKSREMLETILKDIGLKIVHSPHEVKCAIMKSGLGYKSEREKSLIECMETDAVTEDVKVAKNNAGNPFCTNPDEVVSFIATSTSREGPCFIGSPGSEVTNTKIQSADRLKLLLKFIAESEYFKEKLLNLLVLLTGTNKLSLFSKEQPLYCTEFSWMFPAEMDKFVHHDLLESYPIADLIKGGYLKDFSVTSFIELIPNEFKENLFDNKICASWDANDHSFPTKHWITWFWKFVYDFSKKEQTDTNRFKEVVDCVTKWAFLPVDRTNTKRLLQVGKIFMLTDMESFRIDEPLHKSLLKMKLITLDKTVFYEENYDIKEKVLSTESDLADRENPVENSVLNAQPIALAHNFTSSRIGMSGGDRRNKGIASDIVLSIQKLASSYHEPAILLENLVFCAKHHDPSVFSIIEANDAVCILKYFTEKLRNPPFKEYTGCKDKLLSLPLFVTLSNTCVSLDDGAQPYLVPRGMPCAGLDIYSMNMNTVFLRKYYDLHDLHTFLGLSGTHACHLYAGAILPNISQIPQEFWLEHIVYIRDNLRSWTEEGYKQECKSILYYLKNVAFIETNSGLKRVSCFFDHNNAEFQVLCTDDELLPDNFREPKWTCFFKKLGMRSEISDDLLLMFAKRIEAKPATHSSIEEMSRTLTDSFTSQLESWKEETLHVLAKIRFLLPMTLPKIFYSIFPPRDDGPGLICMQGSVQSKHVAVCWSTANIIRFNVGKKYCNILGICKEPKMVDVIKHFMNISTEMSKGLSSYKDNDIKNLMNAIYTFLEQHMKDPQVAEKLQYFPIIHLPSEKKMVSVNAIVLSISEAYIVKPYLFEAPVCYGPFFGLFKVLGTSKEVKCYHYLNVLHQVYLKAGNQEVLPHELEVIKQAVFCLSIFLSDKKKHEFKDLQLFLPNSRKLMCSSREIVMVDSASTKERLVDVTDINYFIGSQELGICHFDNKEFVSQLPEGLRPLLLTDIVKEIINREGMEIVQNSLIAERLSYFVKSEQFVKGICRISKKHKEIESIGEPVNDTEADVKRITELMACVNIVQVSNLETYLLHKTDIVNGSYKPLDNFFERKNTEDNALRLYFYFCLSQESNNSEALVNLTSCPDGLGEAIITHIGLPYSEVLMVAYMLRQLDNPDVIASLLDNKYPELNSNLNLKVMSAFPRPGSYVEERFHPFLQQALEPFDESEYKSVAYEVDDEESDDEPEDSDFTPVYKYVHILEKITTDSECFSLVGIRYRIDIGEDEHFEVPGYRLYRFVRPENPTDTLQVHTGSSPQQFLPLDENCKRIRKMLQEAWELPSRDRKKVFQRLLFQWHPDKNRGSEEYATKVFQFIQLCILRLEEKGSLSDDDETDGRSANYSNSSFNQMYNNVNRRAQAYARAYYDNLDEYNRSQNTGNYSHRNRAQTEVKDVGEARRWMRQAKRDFQAAAAMLPQAEDQKAFNWICYMCHQASEKALKAGCYSKNAKAVSLQDHSLQSPAIFLSPSLTSLAAQMESHLGQHTRMRYPNSVTRPQIPADIFDRDHAEKAIAIAREIIQHAHDLI